MSQRILAAMAEWEENHKTIPESVAKILGDELVEALADAIADAKVVGESKATATALQKEVATKQNEWANYKFCSLCGKPTALLVLQEGFDVRTGRRRYELRANCPDWTDNQRGEDTHVSFWLGTVTAEAVAAMGAPVKPSDPKALNVRPPDPEF